MTSLADTLDRQVLESQVTYLEKTGRTHHMATWNLGQSRMVLLSLQESAAGYYAAARKCRWRLIELAHRDPSEVASTG